MADLRMNGLRAEVGADRVRLAGEIDLANIEVLRHALEVAATSGTEDEVVIDLSRVTFIGSLGLRELRTLVQRFPAITVVLESPPSHVRRLLELIPVEGLEVRDGTLALDAAAAL